MKLKKLTKKQKNIAKIIVLIIILGLVANQFDLLTVFQFGKSHNNVKLISEDQFGFTYEITATAEEPFAPGRGFASEGKLDGAGFGDTISSDSKRISPDQVASKKYISTVLNVEDVIGIENFQSGNEIEIRDVRLKDGRVECTPLDYSNIPLYEGLRPGDPNYPNRDDRAQLFGCAAFGEFKAYNDQGQEVPAVFYGGSRATTTITVLKHGVECTENQLVNCQKDQVCLQNKCVTPDSSNPIPNVPSCTDGIKNQDEVGVDTGGVCEKKDCDDCGEGNLAFYVYLLGFIGIIGGLGYYLWRMYKK